MVKTSNNIKITGVHYFIISLTSLICIITIFTAYNLFCGSEIPGARKEMDFIIVGFFVYIIATAIIWSQRTYKAPAIIVWIYTFIVYIVMFFLVLWSDDFLYYKEMDYINFDYQLYKDFVGLTFLIFTIGLLSFSIATRFLANLNLFKERSKYAEFYIKRNFYRNSITILWIIFIFLNIYLQARYDISKPSVEQKTLPLIGNTPFVKGGIILLIRGLPGFCPFLLLSMGIHYRLKKEMVFSFLMLAFTGIWGLYLGSKGAFVGIAVAILIYIGISEQFNIKQKIKYFLLIISVGIVMTVAFFNVGLLMRNYHQARSIGDNITITDYLNSDTFNMFLEHFDTKDVALRIFHRMAGLPHLLASVIKTDGMTEGIKMSPPDFYKSEIMGLPLTMFHGEAASTWGYLYLYGKLFRGSEIDAIISIILGMWLIAGLIILVLKYINSLRKFPLFAKEAIIAIFLSMIPSMVGDGDIETTFGKDIIIFILILKIFHLLFSRGTYVHNRN